MAAQITSLIDKLDTFEIVRDQIGSILVVEEARQRVMAAVGGKDPDLWALRIYSERSNPWAQWIDPDDDAQTDGTSRPRKVPIANVWFDNSQIDLHASNLIERQRYAGVFNIDCYGYGKSVETSGGHSPGDAKASREAQRAARLVRNILMAGTYTYLGLQKTVGQRYVQSVQVFQPQNAEGQTVQHVVGARVSLHVTFNELSPQVEGQSLEAISVGVQRQSDGLLYLTATFPQES